eukprot:Hpha_TRINITY_DN16170_c1_g1::TRINITY_DN16170_c1_g1_i2::g.8794::m.8794/K10357/MYO5; myosin V
MFVPGFFSLVFLPRRGGGAKTEIYLLEKSRVIAPSSAAGRVYHSFHQLLSSPDAAKYKLGPASEYPGACENPKIPGVDDGKDYGETNRAMIENGISAEDQHAVWATVAGILHLRRVQFEPGPSDSSVIPGGSKEFVGLAAEMWGIDAALLEKELLTTTKQMGRDVVTKNNKPSVAQAARDTICKEIYTHLFRWLVNRINSKTDHPDSVSVIGLLDIFGFEDFEYNGFEQLCINLANEMLQKHYNDHVFKADLAECKDEGIDVANITYDDNQDTVDLVGGKRGSILSSLDEQCKTKPQDTEHFLNRITDSHKDHRSFKRSPLDHGKFRVCHYAGEVTYTAEGMGVKNAESLDAGMVEALKKSSVGLMRDLVGQIDLSGKKTASGVFREQLRELLSVINATQPSWVRCVKPNVVKKPKIFEPLMVSDQLRCGGVLETINIRKKGYPIRPTLPGFVARYKCLLPHPVAPGSDPIAPARAILEVIKAGAGEAQVGRTKLFMKNHVVLGLEDKRRMALMDHQLKLLRFCKIEQKTRASIGDKCRRAWYLAFRLVEQAAERRCADIEREHAEGLKAILDQVQQERERMSAAPVPASAVAEVAAHAAPGTRLPQPSPDEIMHGYTPPMPPPPIASPRQRPQSEYGTYMLFARGPWPVYTKPRPGEHLIKDGAPFTLDPFTVVEAHDTSMDTGEPQDTSEWLRLKGEGWVTRRGRQVHALEGDHWETHGWDPCPDPAEVPAFGAVPASWVNRDGHRVQDIGDQSPRS